MKPSDVEPAAFLMWLRSNRGVSDDYLALLANILEMAAQQPDPVAYASALMRGTCDVSDNILRCINWKESATSVIANIPQSKWEDVGTAIRRARKCTGISQERLAQYMGISVNRLRNYEFGILRPTEEDIETICKCMGITPADLFSILK